MLGLSVRLGKWYPAKAISTVRIGIPGDGRSLAGEEARGVLLCNPGKNVMENKARPTSKTFATRGGKCQSVVRESKGLSGLYE